MDLLTALEPAIPAKKPLSLPQNGHPTPPNTLNPRAPSFHPSPPEVISLLSPTTPFKPPLNPLARIFQLSSNPFLGSQHSNLHQKGPSHPLEDPTLLPSPQPSPSNYSPVRSLHNEKEGNLNPSPIAPQSLVLSPTQIHSPTPEPLQPARSKKWTGYLTKKPKPLLCLPNQHTL
jgi:hypothetical protein